MTDADRLRIALRILTGRAGADESLSFQPTGNYSAVKDAAEAVVLDAFARLEGHSTALTEELTASGRLTAERHERQQRREEALQADLATLQQRVAALTAELEAQLNLGERILFRQRLAALEAPPKAVDPECCPDCGGPAGHAMGGRCAPCDFKRQMSNRPKR